MRQIVGLCIALMAAACGTAGAQGWKPTQSVEFVVPSGPGGAADQYGRAMGKVFERLNLLNGQTWVAVNKPSGTGIIAMQALQQKPGNAHIITLVPFRSSAEALTALLGGHVDAVPGSTPNLVSVLSSGRVRALAISSPDRLGGAFAAIPTWKEQGVDASFNSVYGVMLPAGVPPEAARFWENAFLQLSKDPEWLALLERNGAKPFYQDRQQTVAYFSKDREELAPLVKKLELGTK